MSAVDRFKPYAPDVQAVVRLEEALPPEHPVHVFVDLVQGVDLGHFVIPPGPKGEKPYHPHALFGILAWGYLHGVRSARKLARLARPLLIAHLARVVPRSHQTGVFGLFPTVGNVGGLIFPLLATAVVGSGLWTAFAIGSLGYAASVVSGVKLGRVRATPPREEPVPG